METVINPGKQCGMRYIFELANRNFHSPVLLEDMFNQLSSWHFPKEGPDSKNYHIEFHFDQAAVSEFLKIKRSHFEYFREMIQSQHDIGPWVPIKFFVKGSGVDFFNHKGPYGGGR